MKTYEWSEVVEYLNNNLDKEFDYGNCICRDGENSCLMNSFFKSKGVALKIVSFDGFIARNNYGDDIAIVEGCPFREIEKIHTNKEGMSLKFGRDIKKRLDEVMKQI